MTAAFVYVTAADRAQALSLGRSLVEERLAACANVLEPMTSIYWWDGAVQTGHEAVLILKTRQAFVEPLTARVRGSTNACRVLRISTATWPVCTAPSHQ